MILGGFFADQGFKLGEGGGARKSDLIPRYITADHAFVIVAPLKSSYWTAEWAA